MPALIAARRILTLAPFKGGGGLLQFTSALPSSVTYSRTGAATALTSGGVIVPFAANAAQITDAGLLLEPAATNLLLRSQELDSASWTKNTSSVTADQTTAPDGTSTVDRITPTASTTGLVSQGVTTVGSTQYNFSLFVKQGTSAQSRLLFRDVTNSVNGLQATAITWSGGVPTIGGTTGTWATPVAAANGNWYLSGRATMGVGGVSASLQIFPDNLNGTGTLNVWGAQFEVGSAPTSYIPTAGASATRGLPSATVVVPSGKTVARATYGTSNTVVDVTGLTPGATFDLVTGRPWLGLGNELKTLEWRP